MNLQHSTHAYSRKYRIATIGKVHGSHAWFQRMEEGVKKFGQETGHTVLMTGPPKADATLQARLIEEIVAQGIDALCVVPFFPQSLEIPLRMARKQGIVVITHEASNQRNVDYDVEAFDNAAYARHLLEHLARYMGAEGEYAILLASLTSKTHSDWANIAIEHQHKKYPKMKLAVRRLEDSDDIKVAYEKTKILLTSYPRLKGILALGMASTAGAGQSITENDCQGRVVVVGTGLVSACGEHLKNHATKLISFWDPADAGYVMNKLAAMVLAGQAITPGLNLGVPGYTNLKLDGNIIYGSAWIDVTRETIAKYSV